MVVPFWQQHRGRYSRYLPLEVISSSTTTLRERARNVFRRFTRAQDGPLPYAAHAPRDPGDGEELFDIDERRREALSLDARRGQDVGGRLSRDLEEGFRDDSEDETSEADTARRA